MSQTMQTPESFNERKAAQIAARFLASAPGRKLPYMKLIKLMYIVDRESIRRWGAPATDDSYYAMNYGMVLGRVKELIDEGEGQGVWTDAISAPIGYEVQLLANPGIDELSRAENELIEEIQRQYGHLSQWDLSELTHQFPEWKHPGGSSIPVNLRRIAMAVGFSQDEAREVEREASSMRRMRALTSK